MTTLPVGKIPHPWAPHTQRLGPYKGTRILYFGRTQQVKVLMGPCWKNQPTMGWTWAPWCLLLLSSSARPQNKQPVGWPRRHGLLAHAPAVSKSRSVFREETLGELDKVLAKLGTLSTQAPVFPACVLLLLCVLNNENDFCPTFC